MIEYNNQNIVIKTRKLNALELKYGKSKLSIWLAYKIECEMQLSTKFNSFPKHIKYCLVARMKFQSISSTCLVAKRLRSTIDSKTSKVFGLEDYNILSRYGKRNTKGVVNQN